MCVPKPCRQVNYMACRDVLDGSITSSGGLRAIAIAIVTEIPLSWARLMLRASAGFLLPCRYRMLMPNSRG